MPLIIRIALENTKMAIRAALEGPLGVSRVISIINTGTSILSFVNQMSNINFYSELRICNFNF